MVVVVIYDYRICKVDGCNYYGNWENSFLVILWMFYFGDNGDVDWFGSWGDEDGSGGSDISCKYRMSDGVEVEFIVFFGWCSGWFVVLGDIDDNGKDVV